MNDPRNMPAAAVVGGPCRIAWCEGEHPVPGLHQPGLHQVYVPHQAEVAEMTLIDGTRVEVSASWWERFDDQPSRDPEVRVCTHPDEERAAVELAPGTAEMLAEAAALLGYRNPGDELDDEAADVEGDEQ